MDLPLFDAIRRDDVHAVRGLLDRGINPRLGDGHETPLHTAALGENVAMLDLLLERGARTDTCDKLWDATPLGWATHRNRPLARARLETVT